MPVCHPSNPSQVEVANIKKKGPLCVESPLNIVTFTDSCWKLHAMRACVLDEVCFELESPKEASVYTLEIRKKH